MAQRNFAASLKELAQKMCIGVNTFGPLLEEFLSGTPEGLVVLAWARQACTIVPQLDEIMNDAAPSDPINPDPTLWPGIDPSAPPAVLPEPDP